MPPTITFVTGKLAEPALRRQLDDLAPRVGFDYRVVLLPITVVALATTDWIVRRLAVDADTDRVILPGLCKGDLDILQATTTATIERGPDDLLDLPDFFQVAKTEHSDYGDYDIEILAEINSAHRLTRNDLLDQARAYRDAGADLIDLGCDPGSSWRTVGDSVALLRDEGMRVSIDSFDPDEVANATRAGAELVLSVNGTNVDRAADWGCEVVVLPDDIATLGGLDETLAKLDRNGVSYRIDPVIEPIGLGFANSLGRYLEVRRRYPQAEMMMGVGNLTELTDVDSAGVNVMLLGFCQEVGIRSVLTTQVINWCRSSVAELDKARRLVYHAARHRILPKHLEPDLLMLRDPKLREHGPQMLDELAAGIRDRNIRLFAERGLLHVLTHALHLEGTDPFELFAELQQHSDIDPSHAFYLGYELAKAVTALTLGKNYVQDQALRWGLLTVPEVSHRDRTTPDPQDSGPADLE